MREDVLLSPLGFDALHSGIYVHLLAHPHSSAEDIATNLSLETEAAELSLKELEDASLIIRLPGTKDCFTAIPPETAIDPLVERRQEELRHMRSRARELAALGKGQGSTSAPVMELIQGRDHIAQCAEEVLLAARHQLRVIDASPRLTHKNTAHLIGPLKERGVDCRVICTEQVLTHPASQDVGPAYAAIGGRVLTDARMAMVIADDHSALVPVPPTASPPGQALRVRCDSVVSVLTMCFDILWGDSALLGGDGQARHDPDQDPGLVALLSSGMKDATIAKVLGVTPRTLSRRIARLMHELDAANRFQAGVGAVRRGLL